MSMVCETTPRQILAPLAVEDAPAVARIHRASIQTGFLTTLGQEFTEQMYAAILSSSAAFGLGVRDEYGELVGFVTCAESTRTLYRHSLLHHGMSLVTPLLQYLFRPRTIRQLWETLRYPVAVGPHLPEAEILSIAVSPTARSHGVGHVLIEGALIEFACRGVDRARVAVGAANRTANLFYQRHGFELAMTRSHHGLPMNVYSVRIAEDAAPGALQIRIPIAIRESAAFGRRSSAACLQPTMTG